MKKPIVLLVFALALAGLFWYGSALFDEIPPVDAVADEPVGTPGEEQEVVPEREPGQEAAVTRIDGEPITPAVADAVGGLSEETGSLLVRAVMDGVPVPGVVLYVSPDRSRRIGHGTSEHTTDEEGLVRVEDLAPGKHFLFCPRGPSKSTEVVAGQEKEVVLEFKNVVDVHGIVRDPDGGPVAGADIWLASWRRDWLGTQYLTRTGRDGRFAVPYVHKERSLGATAKGFARSDLVDLEFVDTERSPVEIELVLQPGGGNLRGRVFDTEGRPVPAARVAVGEAPKEYSMRNDGTRQELWCARVATTDASGSFAFTGLQTGRQPLHVAAAEHPEYKGEVEIPVGAVVSHDVHLAASMSVHGVVKNAEGEVVADALVLALDAPFVDPFPTQGPTEKGVPFHLPAVRSDDAGIFRLDYLSPGEVHLYASKGTSFWDDDNYLGSVQETLNGVAGETLDWNPVVSRGHLIRGRVVYSDGIPIGNVFVSATDADKRRYTEYAEEDGAFTIPGLESRTYLVSVQLWDQPDDAQPLEQKDVWPSDTELVLTASYSKVVEEKGKVSVRIDDRAERIQGKGGVVFAHDRGWYYSDEKDGVFSTSLPPGRYQARAMSGDSIVGSTDWFDLAAGEVRDLGTIQTRRGGSLVVSVLRPPALAGKKVFATCEADDRPRAGGREVPEVEGELTFGDLLEGPVKVTVSGIGVAQEIRTVDILGGDTPTRAEFRLQAATKATIHVDAAQTKGFGKLTVTVRRTNGELYSEFEYHERWGAKLPLDAVPFVPPGRFTVEATTTSGLTAQGEFTIQSLSEAPTLSLVLE